MSSCKKVDGASPETSKDNLTCQEYSSKSTLCNGCGFVLHGCGFVLHGCGFVLHERAQTSVPGFRRLFTVSLVLHCFGKLSPQVKSGGPIIMFYSGQFSSLAWSAPPVRLPACLQPVGKSWEIVLSLLSVLLPRACKLLPWWCNTMSKWTPMSMLSNIKVCI